MFYLHGDQPVKDDELDIVVALLHDQVDVATGGGLHCGRSRRQSDLKKNYTPNQIPDKTKTDLIENKNALKLSNTTLPLLIKLNILERRQTFFISRQI
jgi:hypothetical protein